MTLIETLQSTHPLESLGDGSVVATGDNNISRRLSFASNCSSPTQQDCSIRATDESSIDGRLFYPCVPGVIEGRRSITEQPVRITGTITLASPAQTADPALMGHQPTDTSPLRPARIDATSNTRDIKPDDPVGQDANISGFSRNKIINLLLRTTTLAVGVATVIAPVALWAGLPLTSMLIVAGIALLIGAALNYHARHEPTKFAAMLSDMFSREPKNFSATLSATSTKLFATAKHWIGVSLAATTALGYDATLKGAAIAGYVSHKGSKYLTGRNRAHANFTGATAAGVAVGTAERLAGPLANQAVQTGAACGGFIGGLVINSVQGSIKVGEMAGHGALAGAFWGRKLARRLFTLSPAPEFLQTLALRSESSMAIAGGITYGVSAAIDIRAGENISKFGKAVGAAYNFARFDYLNHIPQDFPDVRTQLNNNADLRNLDID